ncbi:MAG: hypothetical protein HZB53_21210 [Chloroflexi bacterium]|nr:hypothetical protein [Chloroflexota bacterium]
MTSDSMSTAPKPFVFVLMPFDSTFDDIYKFGIKGAAEEIGAYAERVDEQIFTEGILDRIFNQIHKADVIVADMTGRSPNVFYEVGYAHALGKIVLLLTKDSNDIPFDLKHRQHTIYGGSIEKLRRELAEKLKWAISESFPKRDSSDRVLPTDYLQLDIEGFRVYPAPVGISGPTISKRLYSQAGDFVTLRLEVKNSGTVESPPIESAFLFFRPPSFLQPVSSSRKNEQTGEAVESQDVSESQAEDGLILGVSLGWKIPSLPSKASHSLQINFKRDPLLDFEDDIPMRLRLHFPHRFHDYPFVLLYHQEKPFSVR